MDSASQYSIYYTIAVMFLCLGLGSILRFVALRRADAELRRKRLLSLRTWWMLAIFISLGLMAGAPGICLLLVMASCIAWYELTRMFGSRPQDRIAVYAGYVLIVCNYTLILFGFLDLHGVFLPLAAPALFAVLLLAQDEPKGYIRSAGALLWGIMFLGYGVSHAALVMVIPETGNGPLGPAGWLLFIVVLTECDDIFQAVVGRLFGSHKRHRIAPVISPNKTWEGFIGGLLVISVLAPLLAPWLTDLTRLGGPWNVSPGLQVILAPVCIALLVSVAGFSGDINMSAIKRDSGVKDSSKLLPGMGGVIDRIDSLTLTAPVYVYFLYWWL